MLSFLARIALAVVFIAAAFALPAQQAPASSPARSEFIIKKGNDTVGVELFSRDGPTLSGEIYQSNGLRTQYTVTIRPDSSIRHVEVTRQGRQGATSSVTVNFGDTLVNASFTAGGESQTMDVPMRKAVPFLVVSFAMSEQIVRASHLDVGKTAKWTAIRLGAGDTTSLTVTRFHADSVLLTMPDLSVKLALSLKGDVVGGLHMAQNWIVERKRVP